MQVGRWIKGVQMRTRGERGLTTLCTYAFRIFLSLFFFFSNCLFYCNCYAEIKKIDCSEIPIFYVRTLWMTPIVQGISKKIRLRKTYQNITLCASLYERVLWFCFRWLDEKYFIKLFIGYCKTIYTFSHWLKVKSPWM